jgi:Holliday junction resolvase RusA-like endonuclease
MSRNKSSLGNIYTNNIERSLEDNSPIQLDSNRKYFIFDIVPMGAVRMSQSDRWKTNPEHKDINKRQRSEVTRYFTFKRELQRQAKLLNYTIYNTLDIVFCVPMPSSWSQKKRSQLIGNPVRTAPDLDNYIKAFMDALLVNDGHIWKISAEKRYAYLGSIIVYQ